MVRKLLKLLFSLQFFELSILILQKFCHFTWTWLSGADQAVQIIHLTLLVPSYAVERWPAHVEYWTPLSHGAVSEVPAPVSCSFPSKQSMQ